MSEREPQLHQEPFSDELETDLYGLIGDMEEDLSQADCAVGEADLGLTLQYFESVLLEVNEGIHLLKLEARRRSTIGLPANRAENTHSGNEQNQEGS